MGAAKDVCSPAPYRIRATGWSDRVMVLPYNGGGRLDRLASRRRDASWLKAALADPQGRVIPLWRDECLVSGPARTPVLLPAPEARRVVSAAAPAGLLPDGVGSPGGVLLGCADGMVLFAADLSVRERDEALYLTGADGTADVRTLFPALDPLTAATLAHARGLLHWHRHQRFCPTCGGATRSRDAGQVRACTGACGRLLFPRIEPAVIVLVESSGPPWRCLLGHHRGAAPGAWSTLAGFVELGESLEEAVRREVAEESGVAVGVVRYEASQSWPFPAGLMVGFRARAVDDAVSVDHAALQEARWFSPDEVPAVVAANRLARPDRGDDSIESYLIGSWLAEVDAR